MFLWKDTHNSSVVDLYGKVNSAKIKMNLHFSETCFIFFFFAIVSSTLFVTAPAHFVFRGLNSDLGSHFHLYDNSVWETPITFS
jgi:hypothetical protein